MKEFNLEEAKAGKAVCLRNGIPARIICFDRKSNNFPIVALIAKKDNSDEDPLFYGIDGKFYGTDTKDDYDLMMASEKKEGWINIYPDHTRSCEIFDTEEEAKKYKYGIGTTIKITWEE